MKKTTKEVVLADLKPHPQNEALYGIVPANGFDQNLIRSLQKEVWPGEIQITTGDVIISGHRRIEHCAEAKVEKAVVWIRTDLPEDPMSPEVLEALLEANLQRNKDEWTISQELKLWNEVEVLYSRQRAAAIGGAAYAAKMKGEASGPKQGPTPEPKKRDFSNSAIKKAADRMGLEEGKNKLRARVQAVEAVYKAQEQGELLVAESIKQALNSSPTAAVKVAKAEGLIVPKKKAVEKATEKRDVRPEHLRQTLDTQTPYLKSRLLPLVRELVSVSAKVIQEQKRLGAAWEKENLVFATHYQECVEYWNRREVFGEFAKVFDDPAIKTYDDVLRSTEVMFRRCSERLSGIRYYTGCIPDPHKREMLEQTPATANA